MLQASGSSANAPLTKLGAELLGVLASVMQLACCAKWLHLWRARHDSNV